MQLNKYIADKGFHIEEVERTWKREREIQKEKKKQQKRKKPQDSDQENDYSFEGVSRSARKKRPTPMVEEMNEMDEVGAEII